MKIENLPIIPWCELSERSSRHKRLIELIDGAVFLSQIPNWINLSLICQLKIDGSCLRISWTFASISGVVLRGFDPPITPGRNEPVSWYLFKIFDTQPCETRNWREMLHGRIPFDAISIICKRKWFGNGRPLMNTPPSWFTLPWPKTKNKQKHVFC